MVEKLFGDKQKEGFLKLSDSRKTVCVSGLDSFEMTHTARQASALTKTISAQIYKECQQHASFQILSILSSHLDTQKALQCLDALRNKNGHSNFNN
jgi:PIN domain nuclease of toxin-antitoxin system